MADEKVTAKEAGKSCLQVIFLVPYGLFAWGFVFWKSYTWILLSLFPELPHLTFTAALLIRAFYTLNFKSKYDGKQMVIKNPKNGLKVSVEEEAKEGAFGTSIMLPILAFIILWLIKIIFL